mmetsp:Transcript_71902/g.142539  ORF Transcript_71902/g.142539 Transcript_71902/m.142539 type:complete len:214 (-) Transcript_71902:135-776(-)
MPLSSAAHLCGHPRRAERCSGCGPLLGLLHCSVGGEEFLQGGGIRDALQRAARLFARATRASSWLEPHRVLYCGSCLCRLRLRHGPLPGRLLHRVPLSRCCLALPARECRAHPHLCGPAHWSHGRPSSCAIRDGCNDARQCGILLGIAHSLVTVAIPPQEWLVVRHVKRAHAALDHRCSARRKCLCDTIVRQHSFNLLRPLGDGEAAGGQMGP